MEDSAIINGLINNNGQRGIFEKELYRKYKYFITEGCRKFHLSNEDSFSAYSDTIMGAIHNILNYKFDSRVTLKTYLFQIYSNKCIDLIRKIANNKQKVNQSSLQPELLSNLPDAVKTIVEKLIDYEKITQIKLYLDKIGEKCKELLLLYEDGYSDKEIAERLLYNNAAVVKTTRLRCREKIKSLFDQNA